MRIKIFLSNLPDESGERPYVEYFNAAGHQVSDGGVLTVFQDDGSNDIYSPSGWATAEVHYDPSTPQAF